MARRPRVDESREPGGYCALPWCVIDSQAYQSLSYPEVALLIELARQYVRNNNGRLLLSQHYLATRGWRSGALIDRTKRELQHAKLIYQTVQGHRPSKASWFALTWYTLDKLPVTTGRGFSSLSPRYDLWKRFRQSGKSKLVLLMLTDFDPDGEEIASSFARSLRDDFGLRNIHPIKVALTAEDVKTHDLPSDIDAKESSPNYQKFIRQHGVKVVELDAAPVKFLQDKLRESIRSVIDVAEYNAQIELECQDSANIEAHRQVVLEAIRGAK